MICIVWTSWGRAIYTITVWLTQKAGRAHTDAAIAAL